MITGEIDKKKLEDAIKQRVFIKEGKCYVFTIRKHTLDIIKQFYPALPTEIVPCDH